MKNIVIESTYDYDKFRLVDVNRKMDKKHAKNLSIAIFKRNLLHLFPVIVNEQWEVMDGQHRLEAVKIIKKELGKKVPLFYIMDPDVTQDDMRLLNSNKINWKNQDYINYFAAKQLPAFVKLKTFQERNPWVNLSSCISLLSSKKRDLSELKDGVLTVDTMSLANEVIRYVQELKEKMNSQIPIWKNGSFLEAFKIMVHSGKYDHDVMMSSTRSAEQAWDRQINMNSYLIELEKTYNYSLTDREKIKFVRSSYSK